MPLYPLEAVVLYHRYLGEADKLVTLYSRQKGKVRAVARGARRPRSRLLSGTQPFSYGYFQLFEGRNLDQISQCDLGESFYALREDLQKMAAATYVAELFDLLLEEGEGNDQLFALLLSTLHLLVGLPDLELTLRYCEVRLLTLLGYKPHLESCVNCGDSLTTVARFSGSLGGTLCNNCWGEDAQGVSLTPGTIELLKRLQVTLPRQLRVLKVGPATRRELREVLQGPLGSLLPRKLKSQAFLQLVEVDGEQYLP